jgi:hypothetical protein
MQERNVVSKRPTMAALSKGDGLTDTVVFLTCNHLSLDAADGENRIQSEQIFTSSGTEHNS